MSTNVTIDADPGDAAAQCFDFLAGQQLGDLALANLRKRLVRDLRGRYDAVAGQVAATGHVPSRLDVDIETCYASLLALNDIIGDLDPRRSAGVPASMAGLRARLTDEGRLDTGRHGGALLSRHVFPGRPGAAVDGLAEHLDALVRVSEQTWTSIHLWQPDDDRLGAFERIHGMTVASLPFYGARVDVRFKEHKREGLLWYSAAPAAKLDRQSRVDEALAALDASGAVLALVPELTLDARTVRCWRKTIIATATRPSSLRWVLIGTGAVQESVTGSRLVHGASGAKATSTQANQAVLVDRLTGEIVHTQNKEHGFVLTAAQVTGWGLDDELCPQTHAELLNTSKELHVLNTGFGRLAVLICEDLGRTYTLGALAAELGIALVLSPIFAPVVLQPNWRKNSSWAQDGAVDLATHVGSRVVAVNSMAITRTNRNRGRTPVITMFTVAPRPSPVTGYGVDVRTATPTAATASLSPRTDALTARTAKA